METGSPTPLNETLPNEDSSEHGTDVSSEQTIQIPPSPLADHGSPKFRRSTDFPQAIHATGQASSSGIGNFHDIEDKSLKPDEQHVSQQPESQVNGLNVPSLESPRNNPSTSNTAGAFSRLVSKMKLGQYEAPGGEEASSSEGKAAKKLSFFQVIKAAQLQNDGHEVNLNAQTNWANVKSSIVERVISLNRASTVTATEVEEEVATPAGRRSSSKRSSGVWDTENLSAEQQEDQLIKERQMKIEFDAVRDGSDLVASGDVFLDPRSPFRESWDKLMFIMIFYTVCNIPYDIAFVPGYNKFQQSFEIFVDILFIFDIVLNFFTAYYDNAGLLVARRKLIIKNYLNNWFTLDFLAAFPLEWISPLIGIGSDNEQAFALLKVTRLLRFGRVFKAASKNHNSDTIIAFRIFQLIGSMCLVSHWLACVWFLTCDKTTDPCSIKESSDSRGEWYLESYYTGILAMMGDGLDDLSKSQKVLAVLITLMGNFVLAVLFGGVANLVQQMNLKQMQHNAKVSNHNDMMQYMNMPKSMQERIRQYFEYVWLRYRDMDGGFEGFASSLPASLNEEVMRFLNMKLLVRAPFFKNLPPKTQQVVAEHVQTVVALPGQVLLKRGAPPQGLFFILRGKVELLAAQNHTQMTGDNGTPRSQTAMAILAARAKEAVSRDDVKAAPMNQVLSAGDYFGERSLIRREPVANSMIALTFCDIHVLYGTEFDKLVVKFPELAKALLLDSGTIVTSDEISSKKPARKGWGTVKREVERIEVGTTVIDKAISEARKRLRENQQNSQTRVEAMVSEQGNRLGKLEETQNALLKQQEQIMAMLTQMSKAPSQMPTPVPVMPLSPGKGAAEGKLKEKL